MHYTLAAVLLVLIGAATVADGQACRRNAGGMAPGHCRSVYDCPMALRLMRKGISTTEADHLRSLLCTGQEGSYPWICCETATTPTQSNDVPGDVYFPDSSGGVGEAEQQPTVTDRPATKPRDGDAGDSANRSGGGSLPPIGTCGLDSFGQRIYGGQVAGLNEFPWMALLQYRNNVTGERSFLCGGSLINTRYVMTAAHCMDSAKIGKDLSLVRLGEFDLTTKVDCDDGVCADEPLDVAVEAVVVHPDYTASSRNQANDIALIRLAYDVPYTEFVQPVCLPSTLNARAGGESRIAPDAKLFAAGWGRTLQARQSTKKMKVQLPVVDQTVCRNKFEGIGATIVDSQLCAGSLFAVDTCDGDSGGPVMVLKRNYWSVEGIVSFGRRCGLEGWPAVYTRVDSFDDWIRETIRD